MEDWSKETDVQKESPVYGTLHETNWKRYSSVLLIKFTNWTLCGLPRVIIIEIKWRINPGKAKSRNEIEIKIITEVASIADQVLVGKLSIECIE